MLVRFGHIAAFLLVTCSFGFLFYPPRNKLSKLYTRTWTINFLVWLGAAVLFVIGGAVYYVVYGPPSG